MFQRQPRRAVQAPVGRLGLPPPRVLVLDGLIRQSCVSLRHDDAFFEAKIERADVPLCSAGNTQAPYRNEARLVLPDREQGLGGDNDLLLR